MAQFKILAVSAALLLATTALPVFAQTSGTASPPTPSVGEALMKGTPQAKDGAALECHDVTLATADDKSVVRPVLFAKDDLGPFTEPVSISIFIGTNAEKVRSNNFVQSQQDCRAGSAPVTALNVQLQGYKFNDKDYMAFPLNLADDGKPVIRVAISAGRFEVRWKDVDGQVIGFMQRKL